MIVYTDAEDLPLTPEQPDLLENYQGDFVVDDTEADEDYLPSQGQESGSSASYTNPNSQHIQVSVE